MSQQQEAPVAEVVEMEVPQFIPTKWAAVAVYGWKLISKQMLEILGMCLNLPFWEDGDHGVRVIMIGEYGMKHPAECWEGPNVIAMDLGYLFDMAARRCQTSQPCSSIFSWYTLNMILNLLHETHHISQLVLGQDLDNSPEGDGKPEETAAEQFAHETLFEMAKMFKLEPDEWTNEPFFRDAVLGGAIAETMEGDDEIAFDGWVQEQLGWLDKRVFFHRGKDEEHEAVTAHSFKEYVHMMSGADPNDETWLGTPIPLVPVARAAADIDPALPATAAVNTMAGQVDNVHPAEVTPAANVICLGMGTEPAQAELAAASARAPQVVDYGAEAEFLEDLEAGDDYSTTPFEGDDAIQALMDGPAINTVTVPGTGGAQMNATGMGMPGTPFIMNGQPVGMNVRPDAPVVNTPEVNVYPPTSMDDGTLIAVVQGLYAKAYNHIFSYCGFYQMGFQHASKVCELALELTPQEAEAVVKMDCLDQNGRWCPGLPSKVQSNGQTRARILGGVFKNTKLPYYKLYINANGKELCRMLVPQNPLKQNNGVFSKPALAAQGGSRIMYIMEGNDAVAAAGGKKIIGKFVDGRYEAA